MPPPLVSVIMATLGRRESIFAAVESVLAETTIPLELLIVDDRSDPEATPSAALDQLRVHSDPRVRILHNPRARGGTGARNHGLLEARGEWICYLDDDNRYHPQKVAAQLDCVRRTGSPVVLCGLEIQVRSRVLHRQIYAGRFTGDELLLGINADTNVLFHRREGAPLWEEDLPTTQDACYFQAFCQSWQLTHVPCVTRPLAVYVVHSGERLNSEPRDVYRGQRRLLIRWARPYSSAARRLMLCRMLLTNEKFRRGRWGRFVRLALAQLHYGGLREWRRVANAFGVKCPLTRRWMVR